MIPTSLVQLLGAVAAVTVVRGAIVFVAAYSAALLIARRAAGARHVLWLAVLASFILIPLAWAVLPGITLGPWIPRAPAAGLGFAAATALSRPEYARLLDATSAETTRALWPNQFPSGAVCLALLSAWAAGSLFLSTHIVIGTVRIRRLAAGAGSSSRLQTAADRFGRELGVRTRVRVLLSTRCQIPYTFGILAPSVMLPARATGWSRELLEAVLVHELAHVRRRDVLTHAAAYASCVLLWFYPPAWLACAEVLREAETSCDQKVIDRGIRASAYAHGILEMVHSCRGRALLPDMTMALTGTAMIQQRIRSILSLRPAQRSFRLRTAVVVLAVFLCCLAPLLAVSATARAAGLPAGDPFFGAWVEEGAGGRGSYRTTVMVITADGHQLGYEHRGSSRPINEGWNTIERTWEEAGERWYKVRWVSWAYPGRAGKTEKFALVRISADGRTRELVWAQYGYPEAISRLGPGYLIQRREE